MGVLLVLLGVLLGGLLVAALIWERLEPGAVRDVLRDGLPLCLYWLGLRLMSRKTRRETIYSMRHRHTLRGIPDASEDDRAW